MLDLEVWEGVGSWAIQPFFFYAQAAGEIPNLLTISWSLFPSLPPWSWEA